MGLALGLAVGVIYCGIGRVFIKLSKGSPGVSSIGVVSLGVLSRMMFGIFSSIGVIALSGMDKGQLLIYCLSILVFTGVIHPIISIKIN